MAAAETFKERMEGIASRYGANIPFYGYNRDRLGDGAIPPLNREDGQKWLCLEIEAIKPDLIIFDSIMSLLIGDLMTPDAWQSMLPLVRFLSTKHIAQIWLHYANDLGKGFGTKVREWEMDLVGTLAKSEDDEYAIKLEFSKTRLRTPHNRDQFLPRIIYPCNDWRVDIVQKGARDKESVAETTRREFLNTYDRLADGITKSPGFDGALVAKVKIDAIRDEMERRGFLPVNERTGNFTGAGRTMLFKAKSTLIATKMVEADGLIWRK